MGLLITAFNLPRIMYLVHKKLSQKFQQEPWLSFFALKDCLKSYFLLHYSICFFLSLLGQKNQLPFMGLYKA